MKKLVSIILIFSLALLSTKTVGQTTYKTNINKSTLNWEATKINGSHNGTLAISEGTFTYENGKLTNGTFTLDMNKIIVLDIKSKGKNKKLVKHLESKDFFDVKNHATGTYEIIDSEVKDGKTLIKGKLTIKGITKNVNFLSTITNKNGNILLKSDEFTIDRTLWGIKYKSGKFFDNLKNRLIHDEIKISLSLSASK